MIQCGEHGADETHSRSPEHHACRAEAIDEHESLRTTRLYDRTSDEITIERYGSSR
jgi:hypothetical protein